jgi:hypothetical protein
MTIASAIIALAAASFLLLAGYLFGSRSGRDAREKLRRENFELARDLAQLRWTLSRETSEQDASLKATIEEVLTPLIRKEQLSQDLSHVSVGAHRDLTSLLDQIADKAGFSTVLLSNEEGLPLAANSAAQDSGRLLATASLMLLVADRIAGQQAPAPLAFMIYDETDASTLCRIFRIHDQRLSLTAVTSGARVTPTVLDPALARVGAVLSGTS